MKTFFLFLLFLVTFSGIFAQTNVVLNKPVTASSTIAPEADAKYVTDGNLTLGWSSAVRNANEYLIIDLGKKYVGLKYAKIIWGNATLPSSVSVFYSMDGTNWTGFGSINSPSNITTINNPNPYAMEYRYIKVDLLKTGYSPCGLSEVEVYDKYDIYNGAIFNESVLIGGSFTPSCKLQVNGNAAIGYDSWFPLTPQNGLLVSGSVGIGTTLVGSKFQINGNAAIGYPASTAAPINGLLVAGNVGLGSTLTPQQNLHLGLNTAEGGIRLTTKFGGSSGAYTNNFDIISKGGNTAAESTLEFRMGTGDNPTMGNKFKIGASGVFASKVTDLDNSVYFIDPNNTSISGVFAGKIGIGTATPVSLLTVNGVVTCEQVDVKLVSANKISVKMDNLADYVFEDNYKLMNLGELEQFLKNNKRLPGMPSAIQVKQTGMDVAQTNNLLLQKIEELTLYIIEQNKRMEAQDKKIEQMGHALELLQK